VSEGILIAGAGYTGYCLFQAGDTIVTSDSEVERTLAALEVVLLVASLGHGLGAYKTTGVPQNANFAQKAYREQFSKKGIIVFKERGIEQNIKTIDDLAGGLRSGNISPDDVPVLYIVRDGNTLILNTRSAQALERAGIPRSEWKGIDGSLTPMYESLLDQQLANSNLTSEGIANPQSTGK
jgi:filamentous hemagglutinin